MSEFSEAIGRQMDARARSMQVDRKGWTRQQWVDDARRLMDEVDGAVTSLVNGHVMALLDALSASDADRDAHADGRTCADAEQRIEWLTDVLDNESRWARELRDQRDADRDALARVRALCDDPKRTWAIGGQSTVMVRLDDLRAALSRDAEGNGQ